MEHWTLPSWLPPDAVLPLAILLAALLIALVLILRRPAPDPLAGMVLGQLSALADAQERQAQRVATLEGNIADRVNSVVMDQTRVLNTAVQEQISRIAAQEAAMADRLTQAERSLTEAIKGQNESLSAALSSQTERMTTSLGATSAEIKERLAVIDAARGNIEALGNQVNTLAGILGNKQARGAFGESQMEQIIADRLPSDAFTLQATLSNGKRADCLIHLPNPPGPIAIDSKFPLESWLLLRDAADDATRTQKLRQFSADVQKHIKDVAERYIIPGETAEGALIFVPSEAIYAELHTSLVSLVSDATRRGVYIVSPTTLWAVLGTMRALLRDVRLRTEAGRIRKEVDKMLADVVRLEDRTDSLRKHFGQVQKDVDQIEISVGAIKRGGQRIADLELDDPPTPILPT
ncbi:MAG: DNA recombination protein RmuC [Roseomonas sp.]|nr:DNA recombination protein RmuC [Roseomonas sp.]MCA3393836.1 DNA recombination protein RmuC [Roseomonas sp.]MCA3408924.1 DNA recombination protein RmuC [Roseomonas sp.]